MELINQINKGKMKVIELEESDMDMLKSCFTYGYLHWSRYYKELVEKYGNELIKAEVKKLEDRYIVVRGVGEDSEGLIYNSLRER